MLALTEVKIAFFPPMCALPLQAFGPAHDRPAHYLRVAKTSSETKCSRTGCGSEESSRVPGRWACRSTSVRKERALLDLKCVEFVEELIYEQWRKKPLGR